VIDATCPPRIASELRKRGYRDAVSAVALGHKKGTKDPDWLERLSRLTPESVLVTFDNEMPLEHREVLLAHPVALAVVDKDKRPDNMTLLEYWNDVIHRHAHRIREQTPGQVFKYRTSSRRTEIKL
jgi:hypothetical protein